MSKRIMFTVPRLISKLHNKTQFDCGDTNLNIFLKKYALQNDKNNSSKTYVSTYKKTKNIIGYYTLAYGSVSHAEATEEVKKNMPKYPIPVMILARLAVDKNYKNKGIGAGLLKDAISRTMQASEIAGLRAIIAHAKDENAKSFYIHHGFKASCLDDYHMMLVIK